MDRETKKRLYNACNPDEPLDPGDPRNVDVDSAFVGPGPRGAPWAQAIAERIELSDRPVMERVTATRGSGMTTELRRLASRLADPEGAHLLTVMIDGAEVMNLGEPVDLSDLLLPIVERTAAAVSGVPSAAKPSTLEDLFTEGGWWHTPRDSATARAKVRERVSAELSRFVGEVRDELSLLDGQARARGYGGVVVLFDSVTRLQGWSANWAEVLASAERTFGLYASYLELPVHVVYTVPPALIVRLGAPLRFLPAIAVRDRQGRSPRGQTAAVEIIRRRLSEEVFDELFSKDETRRSLVDASGGVPRDVLRLLQVFLLRGTDPRTVSREISTTFEGYRRLVWESDLAWLARVHETGSLAIASPTERDAAERLLTHGTVVGYAADAAWYDVHPAALPLLDPPRSRP